MSYLFSTVVIILLVIVAGLFLFTLFIKKRVELGMPPEGRFLQVQGTRVHYLEQGTGPCILMIHGLSGVAQNFGYQVMGELARDHRVIAVDRPGSGYSVRHPRSSAALDVQADVMAGVIDALKLDKPLIVGHSLGGAVALATALRYPDKVSGLALVAPLTHMPSETSKAFAALNIPYPWLRKLVGWTLAIPLSIRNREKVMDIVFGPEAAPEDFPLRGGGFLGMRPSQFVAASTDMHALPDVLPTMQQSYGSLKLPVGVLYGRQDRILNPQEQGQGLVDALPDTELELIDGGHMLPITQPQVTSEFIRRVLLKVQNA
ncbi:MAG TPA: alpha/beta hydrolase [Pseudomonas sabulinigri]|uniref:AB hydrolase-1 domain-containing protein n=1 Tax=marine sediment metagenome TaxID=412755 RepID=A0A0F9T6J0_9ZZZZ|nr:hybrid C-C meta-cleavage hydrolase-carboxylesterase [uncultured bacterium]HDY98045.1 alpha/beta hydrolase [Halopseudomonas sabulinigri]HEC53765.1 alpha/beta hydrolase [Halopseudomonas sabulinigri]